MINLYLQKGVYINKPQKSNISHFQMNITAVQKQTVKPSQQTHADFKMTPGQVGVFFFFGFWFYLVTLTCKGYKQNLSFLKGLSHTEQLWG